MTDLPRHSVSVTGIVVRDDGRVLAIKRHDDGRWVPPGGVLELDETPQDGVAREVYEETGLKVQPLRLSGVYKNMRLGVVSLAFVCEITGGAERTSDESDRVAWLSRDEAIAAMRPKILWTFSPPTNSTTLSHATSRRSSGDRATHVPDRAENFGVQRSPTDTANNLRPGRAG